MTLYKLKNILWVCVSYPWKMSNFIIDHNYDSICGITAYFADLLHHKKLQCLLSGNTCPQPQTAIITAWSKVLVVWACEKHLVNLKYKCSYIKSLKLCLLENDMSSLIMKNTKFSGLDLCIVLGNPFSHQILLICQTAIASQY